MISSGFAVSPLRLCQHSLLEFHNAPLQHAGTSFRTNEATIDFRPIVALCFELNLEVRALTGIPLKVSYIVCNGEQWLA